MDKLFAEKLEFYKKSVYKLNNLELNYIEWTPVILKHHQEKMAKWACNTWKSKYVQNKFSGKK